MIQKGKKINNLKLKLDLEKYYDEKIAELREYKNGSRGAFFENGKFRFISKKIGVYEREAHC